MDDCIFCQIARKEAPADIIFENDRLLAFPTKDPIAPGHTLIIPKRHARDIFDIDPEDLAEIGIASQRLARELTDTYQATGINLLHASGKDAQQSVFHFHLHLVPRHQDDGLDLWLRERL